MKVKLFNKNDRVVSVIDLKTKQSLNIPARSTLEVEVDNPEDVEYYLKDCGRCRIGVSYTKPEVVIPETPKERIVSKEANNSRSRRRPVLSVKK